MRNTDIKDSDIPGADPAAVVEQYEPYIMKLAQRYKPILQQSGAVDIDDLCQVGRVAILQAQQKYNPDNGASFITYAYSRILVAMRRALGFDNRTGAAPVALVYLDEPLPGVDDEELTRMDMLADPAAVPLDEPIIKEETAAEVRAAVARLDNPRQQEIIKRVYKDGQKKTAAAADMDISYSYFAAQERKALSKLRRDEKLFRYVVPSFSAGLNRFKRTFESAVEAAVIWRDEHLPEKMKSAAVAEPETGASSSGWTAAQWLAYAERMRRKHSKETAAQSAPGETEQNRISKADMIRAVWEQEHAAAQ